MNEKKEKKIENYFCHLVIPADNLPKLQVFYQEVFGWVVEEQRATNGLIFDILPPSNLGISAELNARITKIIPSIKTSNIDTTLNLIEQFGGKKITEKTPVDEEAWQGYYALFEDPHGNLMSLFSEE